MSDWKKRLTEVRNRLYPKKTDFAKEMDVSNPTVTAWEQSIEDGGIKELTAGNMMRICEVLKISPTWLMYGTVPDKPTPGQIGSQSVEIQWVSGDEASLLALYRSADSDGRQLIRVVAENVTKKN